MKSNPYFIRKAKNDNIYERVKNPTTTHIGNVNIVNQTTIIWNGTTHKYDQGRVILPEDAKMAELIEDTHFKEIGPGRITGLLKKIN
ncbi:hypothetical protein HQ531_06035 [bacterium]|nr:hypothetical protein [bacterium]